MQTGRFMQTGKLVESTALKVLATIEYNGFEVVVIEKNANYAESMKTLESFGLRPLNCQEALILISKTPRLQEIMEGNNAYLANKRIEKETGVYAFDVRGDLAPLTGKESFLEQVRFVKRNPPQYLSLFAISRCLINQNDKNMNFQFLNLGEMTPTSKATLIIGIRELRADIPTAVELKEAIREARQSIAELELANAPDDILKHLRSVVDLVSK